MKPKTAFEVSGNSPTVSENGAPILTGAGLEDTKRKIREAFDAAIHQHQPVGPPQTPKPQPKVETIYTGQHEIRFHARAKHLTLAALTSSHIGNTSPRGVFEIAVPTEKFDDLIAEALRKFNGT